MIDLKTLSACTPGQEWADNQSSYRHAWNSCDRGDWMLWLVSRRGIDIRVLTRVKVECAKLAEHLMADPRSIDALRVAERFAGGLATRDELDAAYASAVDADAYASNVAAAASDSYVYAASDVATYAADVAAYDAVYTAAAASDARSALLSKSADICRKYINFDDLRMESDK